VLVQVEAGEPARPNEIETEERNHAVIESRNAIAETQQRVENQIQREHEEQVQAKPRENGREYDGEREQDHHFNDAHAAELAVRLDFAITFFEHKLDDSFFYVILKEPSLVLGSVRATREVPYRMTVLEYVHVH